MEVVLSPLTISPFTFAVDFYSAFSRHLTLLFSRLRPLTSKTKSSSLYSQPEGWHGQFIPRPEQGQVFPCSQLMPLFAHFQIR